MWLWFDKRLEITIFKRIKVNRYFALWFDKRLEITIF